MKLYVRKSTDILFATLQTFGVAKFLQALGENERMQEIYISDIGHSSEISTSLAPEEIGDIPNLMRALVPLHKISAGKRFGNLERYLPTDFRGDIVYFDKEADKYEQFNTDHLYPIWRYICHSHGIGNASVKVFPALIHIWHAHLQQKSTQILLLETIRKLFSGSDERLEAEQYWLTNVKPQLNYPGFRQFDWHGNKSKLSALSLVFPSTITGNETDSARDGVHIHLPQIFWLEIFFAFVGLTIVAMPFEIGSDDLLLAYPKLGHLNFSDYKKLLTEFRQSKNYRTIWEKSSEFSVNQVKMLVSLSFLLETSANSGYALSFQLYTKQKMHYPFGESQLSFETGLSKAFIDKAVVSKFLDIIFALSNQTQLTISNLYNAMINNRLEDWLASYLDYLSSMGPSSWEIIRKIILNTGDFHMKNYAEIWNNRGFRRIARAIHYSTIRAEYMKAKGRETGMKPYYELKSNLLQSASDPERFLNTLWDFVMDFQAQTSRIKTNSKEYFPRVSVKSLIDISGLVYEFGSKVVAHALLATAFSLRGKKRAEDTNSKEYALRLRIEELIEVSGLITEFDSDVIAKALLATAYSLSRQKHTSGAESNKE